MTKHTFHDFDDIPKTTFHDVSMKIAELEKGGNHIGLFTRLLMYFDPILLFLFTPLFKIFAWYEKGIRDDAEQQAIKENPFIYGMDFSQWMADIKKRQYQILERKGIHMSENVNNPKPQKDHSIMDMFISLFWFDRLFK